jgi:hypothetical protein
VESENSATLPPRCTP